LSIKDKTECRKGWLE